MADKTFDEIFGQAAKSSVYHPQLKRIELLGRIDRKPDRLGGKPCVRGTRLAVEHVLGYLAAGQTSEWLVEEFPSLEPDDIRACLVYALEAVEREMDLLGGPA